VTEARTIGAPDLAARYSAAFSAYLAELGESGLGAAYDLGREALEAHLNVLELAEAHHAAVAAALATGARPPEAVMRAAADFFRESLSTFETVARGYREVQEEARLEHEHGRHLRALADASVALNSSLTVEEIVAICADAARELTGSTRATVVATSPDRRLPPQVATSPAGLENGEPSPARLAVRLSARGDELGLLEVIDRRGRQFTTRDETILTQLGHLASVAISNVRLYERERTIARTLQRSLHPGGLPEVPGLEAAVRFRPAGEGVELGGDFYDVYPARSGAWAVLIGDVQGKGPEAAAVTAAARHTLRTAAAYEPRPSGVLARLHVALHEQHGGERFCTVAAAYLYVDGAGVRAELACAGHPLPLIVRPDGSVRSAGQRGTLLGTDIEPQLFDVAVELHPGDVLVLYTDGVTEVRRGRREVFGLSDLEALLSGSGGLPPGAVADRIDAAVVAASAGRLRDDVAILALGPTNMLSRPATEERDG
jgi:Stage II sporulation protein E (SpoIIE)/Phosphoserine phosphatase RsbU, N-terminal domain